MKYFLIAAGLALASCSATKPLPHYTAEQEAEHRHGISYWESTTDARADTLPHTPKWLVKLPPAEAAPDSLPFIQVERKPSLVNKVLRRSAPTTVSRVLPTKVKNSTVSVYYGPASVTTTTTAKNGRTVAGTDASNTEAGKKSQAAAPGGSAHGATKATGGSVVSQDSSVTNALTSGGNLAAVKGDDNTLPQTAITQQASGWRAELAKPAGEVAAVALLLALVGGCLYLIVAYKRGKKLTDQV